MTTIALNADDCQGVGAPASLARIANELVAAGARIADDLAFTGHVSARIWHMFTYDDARDSHFGVDFQVGTETWVIPIDNASRRLLDRLRSSEEQEIAAIWTALRRACHPLFDTEFEAERLTCRALTALFDASYRPERRAAEIRNQTKAVRAAAAKLIEALEQHDDYFLLPSGEFWSNGEIEVTLGHYLKGRELKNAEATLRANSPDVSLIMMRLVERADKQLNSPTKARRPGRGAANITHFRELVMAHLVNQLGARRGTVVRDGQRVLGRDLTRDIETMAHGLTVAAFPEMPMSTAATRMALSRLLKSRT